MSLVSFNLSISILYPIDTSNLNLLLPNDLRDSFLCILKILAGLAYLVWVEDSVLCLELVLLLILLVFICLTHEVLLLCSTSRIRILLIVLPSLRILWLRHLYLFLNLFMYVLIAILLSSWDVLVVLLCARGICGNVLLPLRLVLSVICANLLLLWWHPAKLGMAAAILGLV